MVNRVTRLESELQRRSYAPELETKAHVTDKIETVISSTKNDPMIKLLNDNQIPGEARALLAVAKGRVG